MAKKTNKPEPEQPRNQDMENLQLENSQLNEALKRLAADFDNYQKRVAKEKIESGQKTTNNLLMQIFPILDNFRRASEHAPQIDIENINTSAITEDEWRRIHGYFEGVRHIEHQLEQVLESARLKKIETAGKQFDHNTMEAISYEEHSELPEDTIIEEIEGGYTYNDKVVRPAKVRVSKGASAS